MEEVSLVSKFSKDRYSIMVECLSSGRIMSTGESCFFVCVCLIPRFFSFNFFLFLVNSGQVYSEMGESCFQKLDPTLR